METLLFAALGVAAMGLIVTLALLLWLTYRSYYSPKTKQQDSNIKPDNYE